MKAILTFSLFVLLSSTFTLSAQDSPMPTSLFDFTMETLDGQPQPLSAYEGKLILIVNTASRCGLTPQYEDLQALYTQYQDQGLVILGFPANNFLNQEPGSNDDIAEFCQKNYGVSFPMFAKISVKGKDRHPLYGFLEDQTGEAPTWNFHKFLVHPNGSEIRPFAPRTRVTDAELKETLEQWLAAVPSPRN